MNPKNILGAIELLRSNGYAVRPVSNPGFCWLIKSEVKPRVFKVYYRNRRRSHYENNYSAISPAQIAQVDLAGLKWEPLDSYISKDKNK
jgi:hypothetical protein